MTWAADRVVEVKVGKAIWPSKKVWLPPLAAMLNTLVEFLKAEVKVPVILADSSLPFLKNLDVPLAT